LVFLSFQCLELCLRHVLSTDRSSPESMWQRSDALPAVDAGFAANAGSEGGEGAEWQMVARKKATAGTASKTVMRTGSDVINRNEGSQQTALGFEAASTAERKGEAEDLHNSLTSKSTLTSDSVP
jgi:hypothetical protein